MKLAHLEQTKNNDKKIVTDFHGGSIVTATGEEIPITEKMLQHSFATLIEAWEQTNQQKS